MLYTKVKLYGSVREEYTRCSQIDPTTWYAVRRHGSGGHLLGRNSVETRILSQPKRISVVDR